jgi:hypothetical protein
VFNWRSCYNMYWWTSSCWKQIIFSWKRFQYYISLINHGKWNFLHMLVCNNIFFIFILFNYFVELNLFVPIH